MSSPISTQTFRLAEISILLHVSIQKNKRKKEKGKKSNDSIQTFGLTVAREGDLEKNNDFQIWKVTQLVFRAHSLEGNFRKQPRLLGRQGEQQKTSRTTKIETEEKLSRVAPSYAALRR